LIYNQNPDGLSTSLKVFGQFCLSRKKNVILVPMTKGSGSRSQGVSAQKFRISLCAIPDLPASAMGEPLRAD